MASEQRGVEVFQVAARGLVRDQKTIRLGQFRQARR